MLNLLLTLDRIFSGVLTKGPAGSIGSFDGENYRRAIIEKVPLPTGGVCTRCGAKTTVPFNAQNSVPGAATGQASQPRRP